jgi:hypothetical protein
MAHFPKPARALAQLMFLMAVASAEAFPVHNFAYFGRDRERIAELGFLGTANLEGAQLTYTWRQLEHGEHGYDFSAIENDLALLRSHGKALFVQLQDATFDASKPAVPNYLLEQHQYNGGAEFQYNDRGEAEGWVARRWDPAVQNRFQKLLVALGKEFDGKIAGINLQETAIGVSETGPHASPGFTYTGYRDAILSNMRALKRAFPKSVTMQYANFMPGEWLPTEDHSFLRSVFQLGQEIGVGVGSPDLMPDNKNQQNHAYRMMGELKGKVHVGIAVQDGNYNGTTGNDVRPSGPWANRVPELFEYASNVLNADFIFWGAQEPYFTHGVIPFMRALPADQARSPIGG